MELLPIRTRLLKHGDDLAAMLLQSKKILPGDIVVLSSKAVATCEGAHIDLKKLKPTNEAASWSKKCKRTPAFCQAVLDEASRLQGNIVGSCPGALLTEVRPKGLGRGVILTANAGLDESNTQKGTVIGWPADPLKSVTALQSTLTQSLGGGIGIIVSDSSVQIRRRGVTAFAMVVCGFSPHRNEIGKKDLFGKSLTITVEAVADQLASAANFLMGNADQSTPACIVRHHGLPLNDACGWVPGIEPKEDLFRGLL